MDRTIYQKLVAKAVRYFWDTRRRAIEDKATKGSLDQDCAAAISSPLPLKAKESGKFQDLSEHNTFRYLLVKLTAHIHSEVSLG